MENLLEKESLKPTPVACYFIGLRGGSLFDLENELL